MKKTKRIGLSFQQKSTPGYYCVVNYETTNCDDRDCNFVVLTEEESFDFEKLCSSMVRDCENHNCDVYCSFHDDYYPFLNMLATMISEVGHVCFEAPWSDNFLFGLQIISKNRNRLKLNDGSILKSQLGSMTTDLGDKPETVYYAVNALRLVLGSYFCTSTLQRLPKFDVWRSFS